MKSQDIIRELISGRIDREQCGLVAFETSELGQLVDWFGSFYSWRGHLRQGNYFYVYHDENSFLVDELWSLQAKALNDSSQYVSLFYLG